MYNGIGLLTPRGSGTSGHVQTNKFNLRRAPVPRFDEAPKENKEVSRQPNKDILDHNRKRQVEVKLVEYMDELEEQGVTGEELEAKVAERRKQLQEEMERQGGDEAPDKLSMETHALAARKQAQMDKLAKAMGLKDVVWGEAFDPEVQERKKQERIAAREAEKARKQQEWEERQKRKADMEKQRAKEAAAREEERRRYEERRQRDDRHGGGGRGHHHDRDGRGWGEDPREAYYRQQERRHHISDRWRMEGDEEGPGDEYPYGAGDHGGREEHLDREEQHGGGRSKRDADARAAAEKRSKRRRSPSSSSSSSSSSSDSDSSSGSGTSSSSSGTSSSSSGSDSDSDSGSPAARKRARHQQPPPLQRGAPAPGPEDGRRPRDTEVEGAGREAAGRRYEGGEQRERYRREGDPQDDPRSSSRGRYGEEAYPPDVRNGSHSRDRQRPAEGHGRRREDGRDAEGHEPRGGSGRGWQAEEDGRHSSRRRGDDDDREQQRQRHRPREEEEEGRRYQEDRRRHRSRSRDSR